MTVAMTLRTTSTVTITEVKSGTTRDRLDDLAIEEPLGMSVRTNDGKVRNVSITMRTPGEDADLAAGFLFTEGLIHRWEDIASIRPGEPTSDAESAGNGTEIVVELAAGIEFHLDRAERNFTMTSACGVCGKASLDALRIAPPGPLSSGHPKIAAGTLTALPDSLRRAQAAFASTGGIHAAGLFAPNGDLLVVREDVGRHNAVDKIVGARLAAGDLPALDTVMLVSGRASFELVSKALMAQIPILAAVGAPSSLAVSEARAAGMTLVGFLRDGRFNIYSGSDRIAI